VDKSSLEGMEIASTIVIFYKNLFRKHNIPLLIASEEGESKEKAIQFLFMDILKVLGDATIRLQ